MLTIEEIKKELDVGNTVELECIDEKGFIESDNSKFSEINGGILKSGLIVKSINESIISFHGTHLSLYVDEFKYFRIKRPAQTFLDLMILAAKAVNDKVISAVELHEYSIHFIHVGDSGRSRVLHTAMSNSDFSSGFSFIESLYTETFTIESESDIKRIKQEAKITLCNGEIIVAKKRTFSQFCIIYHKDKHHPCEKLWIESLKGATVTQSRGEI